MKKTVDAIIGTLFLARDMAHKEHLRTRSYAQHMALGDFYPAIVDLADSLAETYQGRFGRLLDVPLTSAKDEADIIDTLEGQRDWIAEARYEAIPREESALHNIVDEIDALYCSTIYKLKFLA